MRMTTWAYLLETTERNSNRARSLYKSSNSDLSRRRAKKVQGIQYWSFGDNKEKNYPLPEETGDKE